MSAELKAGREFVLAVVAQYGPALRHAAHELKADRAFVLAAVEQDAHALSSQLWLVILGQLSCEITRTLRYL